MNETYQNFSEVVSFINEMKNTSSTNEKKEILKRHESPFLLKLFEYVYTPYKQYYVTSKNLKKNSHLSVDSYDDLFALLDDLNERRITGHAAIAVVNGFINKNSEFFEILYDVIDRNLKTRATTTLINTIFPNTVPIFMVALAHKYRDHAKKVNFESNSWWASRKLDGVRCIIVIDANGNVKFFSRQGKEFFTLAVLEQEIKSLGLRNKVLDGELCIMNEDGLEDFQGILKEVTTDDHTIEKPMFHAFDYIDLAEFEAGHGDITFVARQIMLNGLFIERTFKCIQPLPQIMIENQDHFDELVKDAEELGYEGIMIRKNVGYEGKRTDKLLKVKKMEDAEYRVNDCEFDVMRVIEDGVEIEEEMLKNVHIRHKGDPVSVGSGFSLEQRRHYYKNPEDIVGKVITVQYFEETTDQTGKHSLRFPVFKGIYEGDTREI